MILARARDEPATPLADERRYLPALVGALAVTNLSAYVRDATVAAVFGANARTDAYFVGAFLPTLLITILVLESAIPALLPAFSRSALDRAETRRLLRGMLATGAMVLACAVALTWMAAVPLVRLLVQGWSADQVGTAASLLRITAGSMLPLGLGAVLGALLSVHHRYLTPPLGLALMNLTVIGSTLLLAGRLGIYAPAWGILAGSCLYLLVLIRACVRLRLGGSVRSQAASLRSVGGAMLPMLLFSLLVQNVVIVERWLASTLPAGRISYLTYAGKLMMSPLLVITGAGGLLAFVAMSRAVASGDEPEFRASLVRSARLLTLLLTTATVALVVLRREVVQLALQHGHFTAHDADMTAGLLAIYALGLVPNGLAWLLYRGLQSRGGYWEAVRIAALVTVLYVGCAAGLFRLLGLPGIAAAFPISQTFSCLLLYARQRKLESGRPAYPRTAPADIARFAASVAVLCAGMSAVLTLLRAGMLALPLGAMPDAALTVSGGAAVILCGLPLGMQLLRVPEGRLVRGWLPASRWQAEAVARLRPAGRWPRRRAARD